MKIRRVLPAAMIALLTLLIGCEGPTEYEEYDSLSIKADLTTVYPIWGGPGLYEIHVLVEPWRAVREPKFYFELRDTVDGHALERTSAPVYWDSLFVISFGDVQGEVVKEFPHRGVYRIATAAQFSHRITTDEYHRPSLKELGIDVRAKVIK